MAMKNPPRRTTIRGQKHLLAYITPEEADVLKAMGGSGEKVHGIPAFVGDNWGGGYSSDGGSNTDAGKSDDSRDNSSAGSFGGGSKDNDDRGGDRPTGISGGQATAMFGDAALAGAINTAEAEGLIGGDGPDVSAKVLQDILRETALKNYVKGQAPKASFTPGVLTELMKRAQRMNQLKTLGGLLSPFSTIAKNILGVKPPGMYDSLSKLMNMPGAYVTSGTFLDPENAMFAPTGGTGAFGNPAGISQNIFGGMVYTGVENPDYTGPFQDQVKGMSRFSDRDGPDTVPASYNPNTGEAQCPSGYMFDEDLQACRLSGGLPGGDGTTGFGELGAATGDLYGRMGLLDIAPTGLGMFKERFGAGFGTPSEFDTANMAFRRSGGVQRPYEGYTLLS